jgi:hypothetical protein
MGKGYQPQNAGEHKNPRTPGTRRIKYRSVNVYPVARIYISVDRSGAARGHEIHCPDNAKEKPPEGGFSKYRGS